VKGWAGKGGGRGGLITCFNIYISHVKNFTSKINEGGGTLRKILGFLCLVIKSDGEKNALLSTAF
jgi:hypothetical protein